VRKTKIFIIKSANRDKDKKFKLTEMSALQAEKWANNIFLGLIKTGTVEIPDEVKGAGMAALAVVGLRALNSINFFDAEPLLDEILSCAQFIPKGEEPRGILEDDIEEVETLTSLKTQIFNLHTEFFTSRRNIDLPNVGGGKSGGELSNYFNIPQTIGVVVSSKLVTLHELDTIYGVEDLYDLLEILIINAHNEQVMKDNNQ